MSVSVAFPARPLAQVGVSVPLDKAYQLAVGAYGWFKAAARSKSFQQLLEITGGTLEPSKSFNMKQYSSVVSSRSEIRGAFVHNGQLLPTALSKASTACSEDPGMLCLRALVTGLLSIYDTDACTAILSSSIPGTLAKYADERDGFETNPSILAALREYIEAVAVEEDNNMLRGIILEHIVQRRSALVGASEADIQACEPVHDSDMNLTIGLLKWLLRPPANRSTVHYPTRSLRVWTTAGILQFIGFDVFALSEVASSESRYTLFLGAPPEPTSPATVVLVTWPHGKTDSMQAYNVKPAGYSGLRPRIMHMWEIPWSAFRHMSGSDRLVNTQYLADAWKYAFNSARQVVLPPGFNNFGMVRLNLTGDAREAASELHRSLLRLYASELASFCGKPMERFVPDSMNSPGWDPDAMDSWLDSLSQNRPSAQSIDVMLADNSLVLSAIILGTVYGVVSRCCYVEGRELDVSSELVFRPDLLFEHDRLKGWASAVGRAVGGVVLFEDWNGFVYEAVLGVDFGMFHGVSLQAGRQYSRRLKRESLTHGRFLLGCQANGMAAITSMAIDPSIQPQSLVQLMLHRGQVLSFPLCDGQFIEAADWVEPSSDLSPEAVQGIEALDTEGWDLFDNLTRADVEPCWEEDARRVVIRIRRKGHLVATVNLNRVKSTLTSEFMPCHCAVPCHDVSRWPHDGWESVRTEFLMDNVTRRNASSVRSLVVPGCEGEKKILLDARRGSAMALYGIGAPHAAHTCALGAFCFVCIGKLVKEKPHKSFIILSMLGSEPRPFSPAAARGPVSVLEASRVVYA